MVSPLAQTERKVISASDSSARDPLSIPSEVKASIRVLVIDDERTLRESCASVLQMDGYNVTLIGRGEEALETVKRRKFDVILVDLYMSQISGLQILQAALEAYKDTIVVVMTGNPSVTSSIEALRAGAWDYLPKPFSATHLQVLIGRASHAVMVGREAHDLRLQLMKQNGQSEKIALIGISSPFRKAVDLDSSNVIALNNLAYVLASDPARLDEAVAYARKARDVAPQSPEILDTLGWLYYKQGLYELAATELERALSKAEWPVIQFHLGLAYNRLGKTAQGGRLLATALTKEPTLADGLR